MLGPARAIRPCLYGDADIQRDVPDLVSLHQRGELHLKELVTHRIGLERINDAVDDMAAGAVARSLIVYGAER